MDSAPPAADAPGSGPWLAITSDAVTPIDRFRVRWEAELVTAALWRKLGESNSELSGLALTFDSPSQTGEDDGEHYAFADDASSYLYTDANDNPSSLVMPVDTLKANVQSAADKMHISISSISTFSVLGTDVVVVATAKSLDEVDASINPFGDPGTLEGSCFILLDPAGNVLGLWSYATGLLAGHGGDLTGSGLSGPGPAASSPSN